MQETGIQWTDVSANIIRYRDENGTDVWACVKCSDGCKFCYSEKLALRFHRGELFTVQNMRKVTPYFCEKTAGQLLRSRKLAGKRVFIGDMTDVFGEWVPFDLIDKMFAVFALRPDVTFQILTKRPERMAEYLNGGLKRIDISTAAGSMSLDEIEAGRRSYGVGSKAWPLPNVWLGTSCEDQKRADERIIHLLRTPAAVRFLSVEPLLGPIDLDGFGFAFGEPNPRSNISRIDWVIVGGESGGGSRPCYTNWIDSIVGQCKAAGVPVFVKQLGSNHRCIDDEFGDVEIKLKDSKGGDMAEFPVDLRIRQMPTAAGVPNGQ